MLNMRKKCFEIELQKVSNHYVIQRKRYTLRPLPELVLSVSRGVATALKVLKAECP
jgi:hypothetical protein